MALIIIHVRGRLDCYLMQLNLHDNIIWQCLASPGIFLVTDGISDCSHQPMAVDGRHSLLCALGIFQIK
ncbi:TPA: hypothetical protein JBA76_04780 [Legionella pneumophila subsp. pneumophila]|uniref:hypothetical protein n=1 Tax=Legionella pneumophila TaxID=446 RepID=UPI0001527E41|nr:hypothetical protein [Legionella pneumophila]HAT8848623.1 hypothetical protein [Legionella pneumophila subsp. pneumophila]ABQ56261.1 hypothetical protein LPC_2339 [Legionella pneumophila str. Corby]MCZ4684521.1 hypothetical protein [Legionella pneumophila]HAT2157557.1 hypothetical protein [Legionella pneumophila]HAT4672671.1 hypothetical protein [Legionella pneumophila]